MNFIINTEVGDFETIEDAKAYFLDNAASFAGDIYNNDENDGE